MEDLKIAQKATKEDYFNKALFIGEAKRWGRPLDRKLKGEKDPFEIQNPSLQISRYLWLTGVKWGILSPYLLFLWEGPMIPPCGTKTHRNR